MGTPILPETNRESSISRVLPTRLDLRTSCGTHYQGGRTTSTNVVRQILRKLTFNADGTIPKLPWFGVGNPTPGVPQVGTFQPL